MLLFNVFKDRFSRKKHLLTLLNCFFCDKRPSFRDITHFRSLSRASDFNVIVIHEHVNSLLNRRSAILHIRYEIVIIKKVHLRCQTSLSSLPARRTDQNLTYITNGFFFMFDVFIRAIYEWRDAPPRHHSLFSIVKLLVKINTQPHHYDFLFSLLRYRSFAQKDRFSWINVEKPKDYNIKF